MPLQPIILIKCGVSSAGRAHALQAWGRGFELLTPHHKTHTANTQTVCYGFKSHFAEFRESNNGSSTEITCLVNIGV